MVERGGCFTHHTGNDDNGGKVLKFGHIPPDVLVDGVDEVKNPRQKRNNQKYLQGALDEVMSRVN